MAIAIGSIAASPSLPGALLRPLVLVVLPVLVVLLGLGWSAADPPAGVEEQVMPKRLSSDIALEDKLLWGKCSLVLWGSFPPMVHKRPFRVGNAVEADPGSCPLGPIVANHKNPLGLLPGTFLFLLAGRWFM